MKQGEKDLNLQLGYFVGDYIVDNYLPTISIHMIKSRNVIQTTIGEADEYNRLEELWDNTYQLGNKGHNKEWIEMTEYRRSLEKKYLPKTLNCYVTKIIPTHMDSFIEGISVSLWGSDLCSYYIGADKIVVNQDDKYHTKITLTLQTEFEPWKK